MSRRTASVKLRWHYTQFHVVAIMGFALRIRLICDTIEAAMPIGFVNTTSLSPNHLLIPRHYPTELSVFNIVFGISPLAHHSSRLVPVGKLSLNLFVSFIPIRRACSKALMPTTRLSRSIAIGMLCRPPETHL